jgi:hypothetical protein
VATLFNSARKSGNPLIRIVFFLAPDRSSRVVANAAENGAENAAKSITKYRGERKNLSSQSALLGIRVALDLL